MLTPTDLLPDKYQARKSHAKVQLLRPNVRMYLPEPDRSNRPPAHKPPVLM